jgi:hypothetical protein
MKKNKTLTFQKFWNIVSTILAVIGLSSMSDALVQWVDFMVNIIQSYRDLTYPIWEIFFGWLSLTVPNFIKDYFTLGLILLSAAIKANLLYEDNSSILKSEAQIIAIVKIGGIIFLVFIFWPIYVGYSFFPKNVLDKGFVMVLKHQLGIVLLSFILLLIVNYTFFI